MTLEERKENLEKQREIIKEQYVKITGAIELIDSIINDEKPDDQKKSKK